MEVFAKEKRFEKHMQLQDVEVTRAHQTTVSQLRQKAEAKSRTTETDSHANIFKGTLIKVKFQMPQQIYKITIPFWKVRYSSLMMFSEERP